MATDPVQIKKKFALVMSYGLLINSSMLQLLLKALAIHIQDIKIIISTLNTVAETLSDKLCYMLKRYFEFVIMIFTMIYQLSAKSSCIHTQEKSASKE